MTFIPPESEEPNKGRAIFAFLLGAASLGSVASVGTAGSRESSNKPATRRQRIEANISAGILYICVALGVTIGWRLTNSTLGVAVGLLIGATAALIVGITWTVLRMVRGGLD